MSVPCCLLWRLPSHIVAGIVSSQLGVYELICLDQACCSHTYRPLLHSVFDSITLHNFGCTYALSVITMLMWAKKRGVTVCSLQLDHVDEETDRALGDIVGGRTHDNELCNFDQVLEVNLSTHDLLTDRVVQLIATCFPMLQKLQLKVVPGARENYSRISSGLISIAEGCPELRELVLLRDMSVEPSAVEQFLRRARKLRCYNILGVTDASSMRLTDAMLLAIAESNQGVPHVTELRAQLDVRKKETLTKCGAALGNLQTFEGFCGCDARLEIQLEAMSLMINLEHVTLPSYLLTTLDHSHEKLRTLAVDFTRRWGEAGDVFLKIAACCPHLQSLHLWNGDDMEAPTYLATTLSTLAHCSSRLALILMAVRRPFFSQSPWPRQEMFMKGMALAHPEVMGEGVTLHDATMEALYTQAQQDPAIDAGLARLVASCKQMRRLHIGLSSPEGVTPGAENVTATRQLELTVSIYGFTSTVLYK
jgi:hypothetical protein